MNMTTLLKYESHFGCTTAKHWTNWWTNHHLNRISSLLSVVVRMGDEFITWMNHALCVQGHFNMDLRGGRDQTGNLPGSAAAALPPEPLLPLHVTPDPFLTLIFNATPVSGISHTGQLVHRYICSWGQGDLPISSIGSHLKCCTGTDLNELRFQTNHPSCWQTT